VRFSDDLVFEYELMKSMDLPSKVDVLTCGEICNPNSNDNSTQTLEMREEMKNQIEQMIVARIQQSRVCIVKLARSTSSSL